MESLRSRAGDDRFEVLPLGKSEEEAAKLPEPVRLTVTCSPKHGPDRSVEVAQRLHSLSHMGLFRRSVSDRLYDALAPAVEDPALGVAGFHYFTFNQLIATYESEQRKPGATRGRHALVESTARAFVHPEESKT